MFRPFRGELTVCGSSETGRELRNGVRGEEDQDNHQEDCNAHNHPLETLEEDEINAIHLGHLYVVRGPNAVIADRTKLLEEENSGAEPLAQSPEGRAGRKKAFCGSWPNAGKRGAVGGIRLLCVLLAVIVTTPSTSRRPTWTSSSAILLANRPRAAKVGSIL